MSYKRMVSFEFVVDGIWLVTTGIHRNSNGVFIDVEELRKNGEEDTHMHGYLKLTDGKWSWDPDEHENFSKYESESFADAIVAFVNENPPPESEAE